MVKPIPEGYRTLTPYLTIKDAAKAIDWYKQAFGAEELSRVPMSEDDPRLLHAEIRIGDSIVMMSEEFPEWGSKGPEALGGSPVSILIYVEDVEAAWKRAVDAGATIKMVLADQFWGDRFGAIEDPFGHKWSLAQHMEDLSMEEMGRRREAAMSAMG
ncbi:MAG TPA: VOC family protein [Gemmatimonadota bacterium]|nr:VOC family protein [Gemmatimonadota bacterium]